MPIKLGMVMDSIGHINIKKDTSFAMLLEAQARGWELHYMELNDLFLRNGMAYARTRIVEVDRNPEQWYEFISEQEIPLDQLDVILMRKDPPFDQEYIYATYLLERAESLGVHVINKPQSLRDANEKLFTAWFPQCCAETLVARESRRIRDFLQEQEEIILKPLDGMGGTSIFHLRQGDPNLSVILETMTKFNSRYVMAQKYLPAIKDGDKRILLVNGEAVPYALARIPAQGETRGNLAAGGRAEGRELTERDWWIAGQVGPTLREKGLVFVGLDVIGDTLTEINVTSPTCVQELDRQFGLNIAGLLMDHIEKKSSSMTKQAFLGSASSLSSNDNLLIALFIAALIHIVLVMGINFSKPEPEKFTRSIDITLVNTPAVVPPKKAKFLAQENQIGAGEKAIKPEPPAQKLPSQGNSQKKNIEKISPEVSKPKTAQPLITQRTADRKVSTAKTSEPVKNTETKPHLSAESLQQQVAQLGAEIRFSHPSADETKIKFVDSVSAHKYMAAQYMKDWEGKVERTGNLNYPEVAAKKNFSATLIMDVGIKADGSIYSIRINKSSGNPALDDAAQRIVRMSAPFAPLPSELLKELDVLVITRVWKFSDESGLVTR